MTKLQINLSDAEQEGLATYIKTARSLLSVLETFNAADSDFAEPWAQAIQDRAYQHAERTNLVGWGFKHVLAALKCMGADSVVGESWPEVSDEDLTLCYLATMLSEGEREALSEPIPGFRDLPEPIEIPSRLEHMFSYYAQKDLPEGVFVDPDKEQRKYTRLHFLSNRASRRMVVPHQLRVLASRFGCIEQCWEVAKIEWRDSGAVWTDLPSNYQKHLTRLAGEQDGADPTYYGAHQDIVMQAVENAVRDLPDHMKVGGIAPKKWTQVARHIPDMEHLVKSRAMSLSIPEERLFILEELCMAYHIDIRFWWDSFVGDVNFERAMKEGA
jgi:hypothetical protein